MRQQCDEGDKQRWRKVKDAKMSFRALSHHNEVMTTREKIIAHYSSAHFSIRSHFLKQGNEEGEAMIKEI